MSKPKNRMISLRLSQEEYEALKNLSRCHGATSVSELARQAMQRIVGEISPTVLERRLEEVIGRLDMLDREVARLADLGGDASDNRHGFPPRTANE